MTVHVINIDIQDNHEEATIGAFMICDLCTMVSPTRMCPVVDPQNLYQHLLVLF